MFVDVLKKEVIRRVEENIERVVKRLRKYNSDYDIAVFVNDQIGSDIITFGRYDRQNLEMTQQVLTKLTKSDGFRDEVCLDIGANIGNHALYYSKLFSQVIAFEPNPIVYKLLQASILRNRITNIRLCTVGLGPIKEKKNLSIYDENLGKSSLVHETDDGHAEFDIEIEIDVGDDLIKEINIGQSRISFIKIDVEGFEADALKGLRSTILKHHPVICIELNFLSDKEAATAAINVLNTLGYKDFYVLERAHPFNSRYINLLFRMFHGDELDLARLKKYESVNYPQVFCVASPAD